MQFRTDRAAWWIIHPCRLSEVLYWKPCVEGAVVEPQTLASSAISLACLSCFQKDLAGESLQADQMWRPLPCPSAFQQVRTAWAADLSRSWPCFALLVSCCGTKRRPNLPSPSAAARWSSSLPFVAVCLCSLVQGGPKQSSHRWNYRLTLFLKCCGFGIFSGSWAVVFLVAWRSCNMSLLDLCMLLQLLNGPWFQHADLMIGLYSLAFLLLIDIFGVQVEQLWNLEVQNPKSLQWKDIQLSHW